MTGRSAFWSPKYEQLYPVSHMYNLSTCLVRGLRFPCPQDPLRVVLRRYGTDFNVRRPADGHNYWMATHVGNPYNSQYYNSTQTFPSCGNARSLVQFVDAANRNNIKVFPRNGFLLGVVRHGGFLPNEEIDAHCIPDFIHTCCVVVCVYACNDMCACRDLCTHA